MGKWTTLSRLLFAAAAGYETKELLEGEKPEKEYILITEEPKISQNTSDGDINETNKNNIIVLIIIVLIVLMIIYIIRLMKTQKRRPVRSTRRAAAVEVSDC